MRIFIGLFFLVATTYCFAAEEKKKMFNFGVGGYFGATSIGTSENFRYNPGSTDNGLKNYSSGGDFSYSALVYVENGIKWLPNYRFEYWANDTKTGENQQAKSINNTQHMHFFYYRPVSSELLFLDVGMIYLQSNLSMKSWVMNASGQPVREGSQQEDFSGYMSYFNLGFKVANFVPSISIGLPTDIHDRTAMIGAKVAYNFLLKPINMQVSLGYDYFKYTFDNNSSVYGNSNLQRVYLGMSLGGGF